MDLTISRMTVSLAIVFVIVSCVTETQAQDRYLAFPRMGKSSKDLNYIAFPRMGRSEIQKKPQLPWNFIVPRKREFPHGFIIPRKRARAEDLVGYLAFPRMGRSQVKSETSPDACCGVGIKAEFLVAKDGKEVLRSECAPQLDCCEGLREITDEKPDGVYVSMCVPETPLTEAVRSSEVLSQLKHLLEK